MTQYPKLITDKVQLEATYYSVLTCLLSFSTGQERERVQLVFHRAHHGRISIITVSQHSDF